MPRAVRPAELPGLSAAEAASRLRRDGPNQLPQPRRRSRLRRFAQQLVHFFAAMLWVAGGLAVLAGMPQLGLAIFAVIVVNAVFAFVQEDRATRAADRLRELLPRRVTVRRDGRRVLLPATEIVVGDVVVLEPGDRVPADGTAVIADGLSVDVSTLTGESLPVSVSEGGELAAGTFVVEGAAEAVVTATGSSTRLSGIAKLSDSARPPVTPLSRELRRVVRAIAIIAVAVGAGFFLVSLLIGHPPSAGIVFAIGVTVALVPEALLPTVTLALAWGAEQMARRRVLVRNLEAVETLGSTTFICTDKTGTLTLNQMTAVEVWTPRGTARIDGPGYAPTADLRCSPAGAHPAVAAVALAALQCSSGSIQAVAGRWIAHGDPTEAALDALARRTGIDSDRDRAEHPIRARFAFDPRRRRMSVVVGDRVLVKGAPDSVLPLCAGSDLAAAPLADLAARGLRVLAIAGRPIRSEVPTTAEEAETSLDLYGLIALEDPPRPGVRDAIQRCRDAGIRVAMITGDHPATAAAIANEAGLRGPRDPVLVGEQLPDDEAGLGALLDRDGVVVARVSPEDKLRIAAALRRRGQVVAMTGDGVNDGPALREADIGIAMGRFGTDVAREAADLVLLDDDFSTIVAGVEHGRATFLNIRRFLTYHLTDNVAELVPFVVWMLSGGQFPLALGVLQILALDIGTDTLSAVALGAEPPSRKVLSRPPLRGRLLDRSVVRRAFGLLGPTISLFSMSAFLVSHLSAGWRPGEPFPGGTAALGASGAAFMAVVLGQMANAFACRSTTRWPGALGWTRNRLLVGAVAVALAVSLVLLVTPAGVVIGQAPPPPAGWLVAALGAAGVLGVDALDKAVRRCRNALRIRDVRD